MAKTPENLPKKNNDPLGHDSNGELAEEIARRIGSLVPHNQQAQVVAQVVSLVQQERFSGPIAHPKHLREYEEICPGAADRIINMAEANLAHSQKIQERALEADIQDTKDGRRFGFAALALLIFCALACVYFQEPKIALAFLGTGILGIIGLFINGKVVKTSDKNE